MHYTRWVRHRDVHHTRPGFRTEERDGRIEVYVPEHPFARPNGYVFRYRLVAEKMLGRFLAPQEVVHHRNGNVQDDRPENLQVFPSQSEHIKVHNPARNRVNGRFV